jgi:hypothetical protein
MRTIVKGWESADILIRCSDPTVKVKAKWHPEDPEETVRLMHPVDLSRIGITNIPDDLKKKMQRPDIKPWFPNEKQIYVHVKEPKSDTRPIAFTVCGRDFAKKIESLTSVTDPKTKKISKYGQNYGEWSDIVIPDYTWKENRAESWYPDFSDAWHHPGTVPWLDRQHDSKEAKSQPMSDTLGHEMLHVRSCLLCCSLKQLLTLISN